jgi:hypothetical protein
MRSCALLVKHVIGVVLHAYDKSSAAASLAHKHPGHGRMTQLELPSEGAADTPSLHAVRADTEPTTNRVAGVTGSTRRWQATAGQSANSPACVGLASQIPVCRMPQPTPLIKSISACHLLQMCMGLSSSWGCTAAQSSTAEVSTLNCTRPSLLHSTSCFSWYALCT